jgi:hypothetical protein
MPVRVAILTTIYRYLSHAQHMGDRFLIGYPLRGEWHKGDMQVVSLYVDQKPQGDQSEERAKEFGFQVYPTIAEALRCGTGKLAVDAVLIIAEHGEYPKNDLGQVLYPRYEFFKQCVDVFTADGRSVPVYNDKHLSYSFEKAKWMVDQSKKMGFPMIAGSSLPVTWRLPNLELPLGTELDEALMVGVGGSDPMDYHALEAMQCMVERRKGGEVGIKSVQLIDGPAVWEDKRWSRDLLVAALSRSDSPLGLSVTDARTQDLWGSGAIKTLVEKPAAYFIERNDGLRTTLLMVNGAVRDYTFAAKIKGKGIVSNQFFLSPTPNVTYSACLVSKIEELFVTKKAPYPVERTLIVSGMLESCLQSRKQGGKLLPTPHLNVRYTGTKTPQHAID